MQSRTWLLEELEIRCFCSRKPLLAVCGRDIDSGLPYIHLKSMRSGRINAEAIVTEGAMRIHCRECLRWTTVTIVRDKVKAKSEKLPESIAV